MPGIHRPRLRTSVAGALAIGLLMAVPAGADEHDGRHRFTGETATAEWHSENTSVAISAFDGEFHSPPGAPEDMDPDALLDISQRYCDEDADEIVSRTFFPALDDEPEWQVDIDHRLEDATVQGTLTVVGMESRSPDCDSLEPDPGVPEPLGEYQIDVTAAWEGTDDIDRIREQFHYDGGDLKLRSKGDAELRLAEAELSLNGLDTHGVPSDMDEPVFAQLSSFSDSYVIKGDGEGPLLPPVDPAGPMPGSEEGPQKLRGQAATGSWFSEEAPGTSVNVNALEGEHNAPGGGPEEELRASASVSQYFCDEEADQWVERFFHPAVHEQPEDLAVDIDSELENGTADATVTLHGWEYRMDGCDLPQFDDVEFKELGEFQVDVAADWDGVGETERMRSLYHYDSRDFKLRSHGRAELREADARGSLEGLEEYGVPSDLERSAWAQLVSFQDTQVLIDHY